MLLASLLLAGCWKRARRVPEQTQARPAPEATQPQEPPTPSPDPLPETPPRNGEALTTRQIADRALPAVVTLLVGAGHHMTGQGSGFFITPNLIATNYHVIEETDNGVAWHHKRDQTYALEDVIAEDPQRDLALLRTTERSDHTLSLHPTMPVSVGDPVYVVGSPQGLQNTFSEGIVSGFRTIDNNKLMQITAPVSHGSSGGPVLNERGEVVGVVVGMMGEGQNLNFAIPVSVLAPMVKRAQAQ